MIGHGRPRWAALALFIGSIASLASAQQLTLEEPESPKARDPAQQDADLADVFFVDSQQGWAVGDRGVVWHTPDGGRSWTLQDSGVDCLLHDVFFLDAATGWVVGEEHLPYTEYSRGVLLSTTDGGATWTRQPIAGLPGLRGIRFFSPTQGVAFGRASSLYPAGLMTTSNGGRQWQPVTAEEATDWTSADFLSAEIGILASRFRTATVQQRGLEPKAMPSAGLRQARAVRFGGGGLAWLVGDGGLVLQSLDAGGRWQPPAGRLPAIAASLDWKAIATRGDRCWVAGSPGSRILHTADAGRSWTVLETPLRTPIHALHFATDENGWAVGPLGAIYVTQDGGRSWDVQRGGHRLAALVVAGESATTPLEAFAALGASEGYRCRAAVVGRRDLDLPLPNIVRRTSLAHDAVVSAGGSGADIAWQFPVRAEGIAQSAESVVGDWNRFHAGQGAGVLQTYLVEQIRMWRPEVVIAPSAEPALQMVIQRAVLQATEAAADPQFNAARLAALGLPVWQVNRVYAETGAGQGGNVRLASAQLSTWQGKSLAELCWFGRGLLSQHYEPSPAECNFRLLANNTGAPSSGDFLVGLDAPPGGDARRQLPLAPEGAGSLQRIAQRRKHLMAILEQSARDQADMAEWLGQVGNLTRDLPSDTAGEVLFGLAHRYRDGGQFDLYVQTLEMLVSTYPNHSLAPAALVQLVQSYSALELQLTAGESASKAVRQATAETSLTTPGAAPTVTQATASAGDSRAAKAWRAVKQLEQLEPGLASESSLLVPLASIVASEGAAPLAEKLHQSVRRRSLHDGWWQCAESERRLGDPSADRAKEVYRCRRAIVRPKLDGILDDEIWEDRQPLTLRSPHGDDAAWPTEAFVAYDDEFLYLAATCRKAPGVHYEANASPRPRDAELEAFDRVDFLFDTNRDWTTAYRLTIDARGWTCDRFWNGDNWNPTWYVAASDDAETWTVEAAISWKELALDAPPRGVWAAGVQRTIPNTGFQSWTRPATPIGTPEGFGQMLFEPAPVAPRQAEPEQVPLSMEEASIEEPAAE